MESLIITSIKLKYDNHTQSFKWNIDEEWNGHTATDAPSKVEGDNAHKGTDDRSGERTNIGVVFDASPPALPIHTKTNNENNKKDDSGFSFIAALLAPTKSGGGRRISLWLILLLHH